MKVLILGSNGMLGPWLSEILKDDHEIIETDLEQIDTNTNFVKVDISNTNQVLEVAEGVMFAVKPESVALEALTVTSVVEFIPTT